YPDAYGVMVKTADRSNELSWTVFILPFIEQDALDRQISKAVGLYTDTGKNTPYGLTRVEAYLCPSGLTDREVTTAPHNVTPSEFIPPTTGEAPYTIHYYGINGPRGVNPTTGAQYEVFTTPAGTVPTHEGVPLAATGMMQRDTPLHLTDG